jgi:predicted transcriptional regulator of viral defense system
LGGELARLFVKQGGVATAAQLHTAGLSPERLRRLVRRGILVSQRRGTYAAVTLADRAAANNATAEAFRVAASIARSRFGLIGSHRSAALMHGLDLLTVQSARVVALTQPRPAGEGNRSGYPGVRLHTAQVPDDHLTSRFEVPCTTVPRTVIDLARSESFTAGVVVADNALHAKKTTRGELQTVLAQCARWPGIANARRVVEFSDERAESVLESVARVAMDEYGLEPPDLQVWVGGDGVRIGRADFMWREHRTIAEADGKIKYEQSGAARRQLERDARLREVGFEVVHFTWAEIVYAPEQVIARIRAAFRRAERLR